MRTRRRSPQEIMMRRGSQDGHRLADLGDKWLHGVLGEYNPIDGLNIIIVTWSMQRQMLIGQQPQMGMRHGRSMPVVWITTVHVGERRLSEAQEQRKSGRDCRRSPQDSL